MHNLPLITCTIQSSFDETAHVGGGDECLSPGEVHLTHENRGTCTISVSGQTVVLMTPLTGPSSFHRGGYEEWDVEDSVTLECTKEKLGV